MAEYFGMLVPVIIFLYASCLVWLKVVRPRQAIRPAPSRVTAPPGNPHAQLYRYADNWAGVPVLDLIHKAEDQAEQEHYMAFPEDRPQPRIITTPGIRTINESRELEGLEVRSKHEAARLNFDAYCEYIKRRFLAAQGTPPMVLGDTPHIVEIHTYGDPGVSYYIEGIGMVRAENRELLGRAIEVVLNQRIDELTKRFTSLDRQIEGYTHSPARRAGDLPGPREIELREERRRVFEAAKSIMATKESKPFGIGETTTE